MPRLSFYPRVMIFLLLAGWGAAGRAAEPALVLKPLIGGAISCGFVLPRYTGLDVEALAARVDLEARVVSVWERAHIGYDPETEAAATADYEHSAVAGRLMGLLGKKAPQVLVIANVDAAALPLEFQEGVRSFVEKGGSLALAYVNLPDTGPLRSLADSAIAMEQDPELGRGVPEAFAPDGTPLAEAAHPATYGNGRVVTFTFAGDVPQNHALYPPATPGLDPDLHHKDHACLLWARALLWLSGRNPERKLMGLANVSPDGPSEEETPPDLPEEFVESMHDTVVAQLVRPFSLTLDAVAEKEYEVEFRLRPMFAAGPGYATKNVIAKGREAIAAQLLTGPGAHFVDATLKRKNEVVDWFSTSVTIPGWPEFTALRADRTFVQPNDRVIIEAEVRPVYSTHRSATVYAQALDSFGRLVAQAWQPITHSGGRVQLQLPFADLTAPLVEVRVLALEGEPHLVTPWDFFAGAVETLRFPVRLNRQDAALHWVARMDTALEENSGEYLSRLSELGVSHVVAGGGRPALVTAARNGTLLLPLAGDYRPQAVVEGNIRFPSLSDGGYAQREDERLRDEVLDYFAGGSGAYLLGDPALVVESEQNACQSPESLEGFRRWMEERSFSVPEDDDALKATLAAPATLSDTAGTLYPDFRLYMEQELAGFLSKRREVLRAAQPQALAGMGAARDDNPYLGYDWYRLASGLDFVAPEWDLTTFFKLASYSVQSPLSAVKMDPRWDTARMGNHVWLSAVAGLGALWTPYPVAGALDGGEGMLLAESGQPSERGMALSAEWHRANATLAPLLHAATPAIARVALLDAPRSRHAVRQQSEAHEANVATWVKRLAAVGHWPTFVHTAQLRDAHKRGLRALVWPSNSELDAAEGASLKAFLESGGRLIHTPDAMEAVSAWATEEQCLPVEEGAAPEALDALLRERDLSSPFPLDTGLYGKQGSVKGVLRAFTYDAAYIYVSVPWPDATTGDVEATPLSLGKGGSIYHPIATEQGTRARSTRLAADAVDCLVRLDYEVREVILETPKEVLAGTRLEVRCMLKTDTATPGKHLIRVTLGPAMGEPIAGGERTVVCAQGRGESYFPVPLNAVPGEYIVEARDLLTGRSVRKPVKILSPGGPGFHALH